MTRSELGGQQIATQTQSRTAVSAADPGVDWAPTAAVAALALIATAPDAAAQPEYDRGANTSVRDREREEYEALGVPFGSFIIRPLVETGAEYTDNFFAADESNPLTTAQSEYSYLLRGSADVQSQWANHSLKLSLGAQRMLHDNFPKDDSTTGHGGGEFRLDVTRNTDIGAGGRIEELVEARNAPDAAFAAVKPVEYRVEEAFAFGGHTFNRMRVSARVVHREYDYDDALANPVDQDVRDHVEKAASGRVQFAVSPRLALLFEGVWNEREYDSFGRSSHGRTATAGANFDIARLMRGEVRVGYLEQEYDDPAVGTVDGLAVNADVDWFPTELTTVTFSLDRQVDDSGGSGNASYLLTRGGFTVDHEVLRNVILSVGGSAGEREYSGVDRNDAFASFDASAIYLVNRNVSVRAGYGYEQVDSDGTQPYRDFDINRAFVSLALRV